MGAYAIGVKPAASGFVIPVLIGAEAIFLGGLAIWRTLPPVRRQRIIPLQPRLVAVLTVWSVVSLIVIAGAAELLRGTLADAPELVRDVVAFVLAAALGLGVSVLGTGFLVTLAGLAWMGLRRAVAWMRSGRPS